METIKNTPVDKISSLYQQQREFFDLGQTRQLAFRIKVLKQLKEVIKNYEEQLLDALAQDFGKPRFEGYASELGFTYEEINIALKNLKSWSAKRRVSSPLSSFPSRSYILAQPKGVCLVIGPWNYPFQLLMAPVVAALAAGNAVMVKPPEQTYHTSKLIEEMLSNHFDKEFLAVVQGEGHVVVPQMMNSHRFDHVFFTGSVPVGRKIAEMAASKLVPTTLELGGKSPAVVDGTANLKVAARRIAFGKWLNAGQTCVAPDYLLVHKSNYEHFIEELQKVIREFYGSKPLESKDYTRIVNKDRYQALKQYLQYGKLRFGGSYNDERLMIEPTLITDVPMDSPLMQEEIFGPILPILSYEKPREALDLIQQNPNPLAFYIFTKDKAIEDTFVNELSFGGGAINNTVVHLTNPELPFGGIGNSGIGNYHGRYGFDAFSHFKSIMKSGTWFDLKRKYPPYSQAAYRMIKWLMK